MKSLTTLLIIFYLLCNSTPAYALNQPTDKGQRVNTHVDDKPSQSCHKWTENGWIVELDYYTQPELDGQITPLEIAYSDYLSDFNHYFTQYPKTCKIAPKSL